MRTKLSGSWRTTLGGVKGAVGTMIVGADLADPWPINGAALMAIAIGWLGYKVRDNKVTSEQAGANS